MPHYEAIMIAWIQNQIDRSFSIQLSCSWSGYVMVLNILVNTHNFFLANADAHA